jgi:pyruvate kinase
MRILVLEDTISVSKFLKKRLEREGHEVVIVENGEQGFVAATSWMFDLFLTDMMMPHWDGTKFIQAMETVCPDLPIIVFSAMEPEEVKRQLKGYDNVIDILSKSGDIQKLWDVVSAISKRSYQTIRKLARIVCTVGPACNDAGTLGQMILSGMDVARLNFSHGAYDQHLANISAVREAEAAWSKTVAILQDLCGPKIRTGPMAGDGIELVPGQTVTIQAEPLEGTAGCFSTIVPSILSDLRVGHPILLDDGLMQLLVEEEGEEEVVCRVVVGGLLKSNKGMNLPETKINMPSVTEKDRRDLAWGLEHGVDFVALSFVREASEIIEIKEIIRKKGSKAGVVAKIEKPEAVENIDSIIEAADAIMIARGDMGVELAASRVPGIQRDIIRKCWDSNTPVITATQMLDSMTTNYRPTRAEVTDVSTAIREGTDAVMLSGETAAGVDPVNVVRTMSSIVSEEEKHNSLSPDDWQRMIKQDSLNPGITAGTTLADSTAIAIVDFDGAFYRHLSKWIRNRVLFLITDSAEVARQSCLMHGVIAIIVKERLPIDMMIPTFIEEVHRRGYVSREETVTIVEGAGELHGGVTQVGAIHIVKV